MHRFSLRSDESADLIRRATEAPANVLYGTLRRPTECNAVRADDFVAAVENLCIIRAHTSILSVAPLGAPYDILSKWNAKPEGLARQVIQKRVNPK